MKIKAKRIICIATMTVMLLSTMGVGAFAAVDQGISAKSTDEKTEALTDEKTETATEEQIQEQTEEQIEEQSEEQIGIQQSEETASDEVNSDMTTQVQSLPANLGDVANVKTLPGHQRIKISWNRLADPMNVSEEVDRYIVKRANKGSGYYVDYCTVEVKDGIATASGYIKTVKKTGTGYYVEDHDVGDGLIDYNGTWGRNGGTYKYKVIAQKDYVTGRQMPAGNTGNIGTGEAAETVTVSSNEATATVRSDTCVRTSYVKLKLKTAKNLTSHGKKKIKKTFRKGSTIYTCSFGIGQFMFIYKDHMFWLNRISTRSQSTGYTREAIYTDSAEYFVNSRPERHSKTSKLIWINTYTQRLYIFNRNSDTGKWVLNGSCKAGWRISTGRSSTPTIRTIDPKTSVLDSGRKIGKIKSISKKIRSRHGIPCWNCFSSYNAIHGKRAKWSINSVPRSGGCVRNTNDHAKWIYNNCPKGTGVIIF